MQNPRKRKRTDLHLETSMESEFDPLSRRVIGCAIEVHKKLGPGLLESVYEECLVREFEKCGLRYRQQVSSQIIYDGEPIDKTFIADLIVEEVLCVEIKSVEYLTSLHKAQLHTYLKILNLEIGLLINFETYLLKDGIRRVERVYPPDS